MYLSPVVKIKHVLSGILTGKVCVSERILKFCLWYACLQICSQINYNYVNSKFRYKKGSLLFNYCSGKRKSCFWCKFTFGLIIVFNDCIFLIMNRQILEGDFIVLSLYSCWKCMIQYLSVRLNSSLLPMLLEKWCMYRV